MSARSLFLCAGLALLLPFVLFGCSDDDGGTDPGPPPADVAGMWDFDLEVIAKAVCNREIGDTTSFDFPIGQNGGSGFLLVDGSIPVPLTISGNRVTGSYNGEGPAEIGLDVDMTLVEGVLTGTWTLRDPVEECEEVFDISANRISDPPSQNLAGYWNLDVQEVDSNCNGPEKVAKEILCRRMRVEGNSVILDDEDGPIVGIGSGDDVILFRMNSDELLIIQGGLEEGFFVAQASAYDIEAECSTLLAINGTKRELPCGESGTVGDFSGFWMTNQQVIENTCGFEVSNECIEVVQNGDLVEIVGEGTGGSVVGDVLTMRQQFAIGTQTYTSEVVLTLSQGGNEFTGTNTLTVVDSQNSENNCVVRTNISGTRVQSCTPIKADGMLMGIDLVR